MAVNFITENPVTRGWDQQQARTDAQTASDLRRVQVSDAIDQSRQRRDEQQAMSAAMNGAPAGEDTLATIERLMRDPGVTPGTRLQLMGSYAQLQTQRAAAARAQAQQQSTDEYRRQRLENDRARLDTQRAHNQATLANEPLVQVMTPEGPRLVRRSQAEGQVPVTRSIDMEIPSSTPGGAPTRVSIGAQTGRGRASDPTQPTQTEQTRLQQNIADNTARLQRVEDIERSFRPEYQQIPTQGVNWARGMYERFGGTLSPDSQRQLSEYTGFRSRAFNELTQTLRQMSGAAVTPSEAERLLQVIGDPSSDSPTQFRTKIAETLRAVRLANARLHHYLRSGLSPSFRSDAEGGPVALSDMEGVIRQRADQLGAELQRQGVPDADIIRRIRATITSEFGAPPEHLLPSPSGQRSDAGGPEQMAQAPAARADFAAGRTAPEPPNSMGDTQPLYAPGAPMPDAPRSMWQMDPRSAEPHPMIPQGTQPTPGAPTTPNLYRPNGARSPAFDPSAPASDFGDGMGGGDRAQVPAPYRTPGMIRDDYGQDVAPGQRMPGGPAPNGYRPESEYTYPGAAPPRAPVAPGAPGVQPPGSPQMAIPRGQQPIYGPNYVDTLFRQEGTGVNPRSSAAGYGQFLAGTWLGRPDAPGIFARIAQGNPNAQALLQRAWAGDQQAQQQILALRNDPQVARAAVGEYVRQTAAVFRNAGIPINDTNLALAHFLGPAGATRFLRAVAADPNMPVNRIMPAAVLRANPQLMAGGQPITAGQLLARYQGNFGGAAPTAMPPPSDPSMGSNPDQNPGIAPLALPAQPEAPRRSAGPQIPDLYLPGALTPSPDRTGALVQRDLDNLARQAPDLVQPTVTAPPTPTAAPAEPAPAPAGQAPGAEPIPPRASDQQGQAPTAYHRLVADLRRVVAGEDPNGPMSDAVEPSPPAGAQLAQAAPTAGRWSDRAATPPAGTPAQPAGGAAPPAGRWSDRMLTGQDAPTQEVRTSTRGAPERGPIVGDDASRGAGIATQLRASLAPQVNDQIRRFAAARFPDMPIDQAVRRYGVVDGNIVYADNDGRIWRETPSVSGGNGVADTAGRVMAWLASGVGSNLPQAAGAVAGALTAPLSPAGAVPVAGAVAGGVDLVRQAVDRALAGESAGNLDYGNAALHGVQAAAGQGATAAITRAATRNPLRVGARDVNEIRDNLPQIQADDRLAQRYGITVTPGENTGARSLLARQRQIGRQDEAATTMGNFYRQRNNEQVPAGYETFSREITGTPAGQPVQSAADAARRFQTGADEAMQGAITARQQAASPLYQRAYANGIQWNDELANLMTRPAMREAWTRAQQIAANEGHTLPQIISVAQDGTVTINRVPDMRAIDYIKRGLDDVVQGARNQTTGRIETDAGRGVDRLRREFLGIVDGLNPDYAAARAQFASDSPGVTAITQGPVGRAAQERQDRFRQAPIQVFDRNSADPTTIRVARQAFERAGRVEDWNAGLHAFLTDRFQQAMRGANTPHDFHRAVWADPRQRAILMAAMTPEQQTAFRDFMRVMDMVQRAPAEGAATATDLGGRVALAGPMARGVAVGTAVIGPWQIPTRIRNFALDLSGGRNAARIADIITRPNSVAQLQGLRTIPPNGQRALSIVDNVLADLGVSSTGANEPNDQPIPLQRQRP